MRDGDGFLALRRLIERLQVIEADPATESATWDFEQGADWYFEEGSRGERVKKWQPNGTMTFTVRINGGANYRLPSAGGERQ